MFDTLKDLPIWLVWKYQKKEEGKKPTKVPYQINGKLASTTNPSTWTTYAKADSYKNKNGIGIVFESTANMVGVDFDDILSPTSPDFNLLPICIQDFLNTSKTYIEFSPSKTGVHVLFKITEPTSLSSNKHYFDIDSQSSLATTTANSTSPILHPHVEIYTSGRYFTFTNDPIYGSLPIRIITPDDFISLISILGYPWKHNNPDPSSPSPLVAKLSEEDLLIKCFPQKMEIK